VLSFETHIFMWVSLFNRNDIPASVFQKFF
jgi:hypothetical protein